jgi:hypothetical protein
VPHHHNQGVFSKSFLSRKKMAVPHDEGRFVGSPPKEKVALPILGEVLSQKASSLDI